MDGSGFAFENAQSTTPVRAARHLPKSLVWRPALLLGVDAVTATANGLAALFAISVFGAMDAQRAELASSSYSAIWVAATVLALAWFRSQGHYHRRQALADQVRPLVAASLFGLLATTSGLIVPFGGAEQALALVYWLLFAPALLTSRAAVRGLLKEIGLWDVRARLFVAGSRVREVRQVLSRRSEIGVQVNAVSTLEGRSVEQVMADLRATAREQILPVYAPSLDDRVQASVIDQLVTEGIAFILVPAHQTLPLDAQHLSFPPEDLSLIEVRDALARPLALGLKRTLDIIIAFFGFIVISPLMLMIAIAVRLDGGPALYRQQRVGANGKIFDVLKFRSMGIDANQALQILLQTDPLAAAHWAQYQKLDSDPRVTPVGRFIRRTNLDELPQLLNVLKGDMSLVGPRPMTLDQVSLYGGAIDAYQRMRPGITGLWQTNGRNATSFDERARLDKFYVRNWSLWRDAVILFRTIREIAAPTGR